MPRYPHTRGRGNCSACGKRLAICPVCKERTLHRVFTEDVCENRCAQDQHDQDAWKREMREALRKAGLEFAAVPA